MQTYGHSPLVFNIIFALNAVGIIGASQVNRLLLRRATPDQVLVRASIASIVAALLLAAAAYSGLGGQFTVLPLLFAASVQLRPDGRQHHGRGAERRSQPGGVDLGPDGRGVVRGRGPGVGDRRPAARRHGQAGGGGDVRVPGGSSLAIFLLAVPGDRRGRRRPA